jgi:hypothetical protein
MVMTIEHVLKTPHDDSVQAGIAFIVHTISQCLIRIIDVDLGKNWRFIGRREKRACTVREGSMDFECIGTSSWHILSLASN